jgi:hypothetical protein
VHARNFRRLKQRREIRQKKTAAAAAGVARRSAVQLTIGQWPPGAGVAGVVVVVVVVVVLVFAAMWCL